jgi:hypothetical protein
MCDVSVRPSSVKSISVYDTAKAALTCKAAHATGENLAVNQCAVLHGADHWVLHAYIERDEQNVAVLTCCGSADIKSFQARRRENDRQQIRRRSADGARRSFGRRIRRSVRSGSGTSCRLLIAGYLAPKTAHLAQWSSLCFCKRQCVPCARVVLLIKKSHRYLDVCVRASLPLNHVQTSRARLTELCAAYRWQVCAIQHRDRIIGGGQCRTGVLLVTRRTLRRALVYGAVNQEACCEKRRGKNYELPS